MVKVIRKRKMQKRLTLDRLLEREMMKQQIQVLTCENINEGERQPKDEQVKKKNIAHHSHLSQQLEVARATSAGTFHSVADNCGQRISRGAAGEAL